MEYFVDIALRPDAEFAPYQLLGVLYAKLHRILITSKSTDIAVCFPDQQARPPSLGTRVRLLGSRPALERLTSADWLLGMRDHVKVGDLTIVPADAEYRTLRRVQVDSSPGRLRRRLMKRRGLDEAQAKERIPDSAAKMLSLPFVQLHSQSTGQTFRLFLSLGPKQSAPVSGDFNAYGLSQKATIPWF